MTHTREVTITSCGSCPHFRSGGYTMYCGHPVRVDMGEAGAHIITHENSKERVPDECPLLAGHNTTVLTVTVRKP